MRTMHRMILIAACALAAGCKERSTPAAPDAGTDAGVCVVAATEHAALLNASTDATVVRKLVVLPALPGGDVPRPLPAASDDAGAGP